MQTLNEILPKIVELNADKQILAFMYKFFGDRPLSNEILGIWDDSLDTAEYHCEKPSFSIAQIRQKYKNEKWIVSISSRVILVDGIHYLPMMDFQIPVSSESEDILAERILEMCKYEKYPGGWLMQTNNSYHFIGSRIVDLQKWLAFIGSTLLLRGYQELVPLVDDKFIGYCLRRLDAPLRLSKKGEKESVPFVVREIFI